MPILAQKQKEIFWFYKVTIGWGQHRLVCVYVFLNNTNLGLIMHFFLPFIACDVEEDKMDIHNESVSDVFDLK